MSIYDPPGICGTGLLPGTRNLGNELARLFGVPSPAKVGGYNPRCVYDHSVSVGQHYCPFGHVISFHAESRAFDAMCFTREKQQEMIDWLLLNQISWGIQEIVCGWGPIDGTPARWKAGEGWKKYGGMKNHRDHVHVSQTIEASHRIEIPYVPSSQEEPMILVPLNTMPSPEGRLSFFELKDWGGGKWSVLGFNGAKLEGSIVSPTDTTLTITDLPYPLVGKAVGLHQIGEYLFVVAADGGTFGYRIL